MDDNQCLSLIVTPHLIFSPELREKGDQWLWLGRGELDWSNCPQENLRAAPPTSP